MAPCDHIGELRDAGFDKSFVEVAPNIFGRFAIVRDKAALGCDDDFIPFDALRRQLF